MTRILIADSDRALTTTLREAFGKQRSDFSILTAQSGIEATGILSQQRVDLVLTDLGLPEMDGFLLLTWAQERFPELPVYVMSTDVTPESEQRLLSLGAIACLAKPLDVRATLNRFNDTLCQTVSGQINNLSLAALLQLLGMERKSCTLVVTCEDKRGTLVVSQGFLVDAETGEQRGESAAIAIISWSNLSISIGRHRVGSETITIEKPLAFVLMEAMRLQDEATRGEDGATSLSRSIRPSMRPSWRPSMQASDSNQADPWERIPTAHGKLSPLSVVRAIAIVQTATGSVMHSVVRDDCPVGELARMAASVLKQEAQMLGPYDGSEGIEEVVLSMASDCDVIRPLGATAQEFALLVFSRDETNLAMARLELDRFIANYASRIA